MQASWILALRRLDEFDLNTSKSDNCGTAIYLAGTNTRRVKRVLFGLFEGAIGKGVVSRAWRKAKVDWDFWRARDLPIRRCTCHKHRNLLGMLPSASSTNWVRTTATRGSMR